LYAAGVTGLYRFMLPLTPTSTPIEAASGFSDAVNVATDGTNIYVPDPVARRLYVFFAHRPYSERCSFWYGHLEDVALSSPYVYLSDTIGPFAGKPYAPFTQYLNTPVYKEIPAVCDPPRGSTPSITIESPSAPTAIGADGNYVYVGTVSGTISTYAVSGFASSETPSAIVPMPGTSVADPVAIAVTSTDLYVADRANSSIDDYSLPLSSSSTPTIMPVGRCASPTGVATYPSTPTPTKLYVADCKRILTFLLPITASSRPTVDTPTRIDLQGIAIH
jgi:hypothetical protein